MLIPDFGPYLSFMLIQSNSQVLSTDVICLHRQAGLIQSMQFCVQLIYQISKQVNAGRHMEKVREFKLVTNQQQPKGEFKRQYKF